MDERILKNDERAVFALREIYRKFGYQPYKMGKFEEYDFYVRNKDFLLSDSIITFNDTNGKLMALKPDVTLSIIKNYSAEKGGVSRVYYNENVYRVSDSTHSYKEIMQTGLECFGDIGIQNYVEVLHLATDSLEYISDDFILEVSHLGILSGLLKNASDDSEFIYAITACIGEKNAHEIPHICRKYGVSTEFSDKLQMFVSIYGERSKVLSELRPLIEGEEMEEAYRELEVISASIENSPFKDKIIFDFSIVGNMKFYNGVVFRGFILGIPDVVLSGGQYDKLMKRNGKTGGAIGFAVYLDLLERMNIQKKDVDVDIVLLYDENEIPGRLIGTVMQLSKDGSSVSLQKTVPETLRYRKLMKMTDRGAEVIG
ncbi:MAG: ATP phosphoribosyltransferase regulatory subunit [Oscillospiraceae bacterium]|nr:ATP phosphoribosyltransferase regulatory subunit [Oscillospiraceae bacterium]